MGDLTINFSRQEFTCKCGCEYDTSDYELVVSLEELREAASEIWGTSEIWGNVVILINSAARCHTHNEDVGGSPQSQHLLGKAADIVVLMKAGQSSIPVSPKKIADLLDKLYPNKYGIGTYDNFTHFDVRANKARW